MTPIRIAVVGLGKIARDQRIVDGTDAENAGLYRRFAELARNGEGDVDLAPFRLVTDAFMLGRRVEAESFIQ